ncbi:MAG: hypothetical protein CVU11_16705, partial [Bacteroidetes bacterium HGW-Bacteroidetes-6]
IDRWILSELHSLIKEAEEAYEDYEPTKVARAISYFVQENLSNWYVRLCRRRFWKGEYEADKIGMVFMALAGYDPAEGIKFWERMAAKQSGPSIPQFLSTHPSDENRIKAMKEFLPTANKYYKPQQ